jgi:O-antigen/teichoic acid export membrane protein
MDMLFSFSISAVIIAFGVWVVAVTFAAGWSLAWPLMGLLAVIVGLISLYGSIRDARTV